MGRILVISLGPWQSVMASASLKEAQYANHEVDVLAILPTHESKLIKATQSILAQANECRAYYFDGSENLTKLHKEAWFKARKEYDIVLCPFTYGNKATNYIVSKLSDAKVNVYEDGLESLFVQNPKWSISPYKSLKAFIKRLKDPVNTAPHFANRVSTRHHLLPVENAPINDRVTDSKISTESIKEVFSQIDLPECKIGRDNAPKTLILGTNFAAYRILTPSQEYGPVETAINTIPSSNDIIYKPHPRVDPVYTDFLKYKYPNLTIWPEDLNWLPVEVYLGKQKCEMVLSLMSSALYYAKLLYSTDCYLLEDIEQELTKKRSQSFATTFRFIKNNTQFYKANRSES